MYYLIFLLLLLCSFIYSATETALFALPEYRRKDSPLIYRLMSNPKLVLVSVIIGNIGVNVAISSIGEDILKVWVDLFFSALILTILIVVFGEYIPKRVAIAKSKKIATSFAPIVIATEYILYPVLLLFRPLTRTAIRRRKFTAGDLRQVLIKGRKEGVLTDREFNIMTKLSRLHEIKVREIMIPRIETPFVEKEESMNDALKKVGKRRKRIPVFSGTRDKIIGILELKKLYGKKGKVKNFMSLPVFVSENISLVQLMKIFRNSKHKLVVVIDEYGGTSGVIDIEDIEKELIWEDRDISVHKKGDNEWDLPGSAEIEEIQHLIPIPLSNDYRTISGFIYTILERIPKEGEVFSYRDYELVILDVKDNHIREVKIKKKK
ncbi:HlyC/CorC family transporter [candidate division WOR-3 bacterium]|nr:HlyC/CorC family transporter [candidate division WOR-3 bacterium]